jgi:hypothetical protein
MKKVVPAIAIAKCLREIHAGATGDLIVGALALREVTSVWGITVADFAAWVEGWARFERTLETTSAEAVKQMVLWARLAENRGTIDDVGSNVGLAQTAPDNPEADVDKAE